MFKEKILVIGACGQIGVELTLALRKIYGNDYVVASDLREENPLLKGTGPYVTLDVMNKEMLHVMVIRQNITQIYLLAAILSATGEKNPQLAWSLNTQSLLNVLEISKDENVKAILINIFGGIVRCDRVAQGVVDAYKNMGGIPVPIIVRLQGTNAEEAKKLIDESGLNVHSAVLLQEAADKVRELLA